MGVVGFMWSLWSGFGGYERGGGVVDDQFAGFAQSALHSACLGLKLEGKPLSEK